MRVEDDDGVRTITFDRPNVMNAMNLEVATELADAVAEADPVDHDAIVLTGDDPAFSAGGDIQAMKEREEGPRESYERVAETFNRAAAELLNSDVPVVAKVNGDCVGAGLAIVAASDMAYTVPDATFSCAFIRVGLVPDTAATFTLPRLVGLRTAKRLTMTGEFFDGAEAAEMGLVNEAVPEDELDEAVDEIVGKLSRRPTRTVGMTKQAIHENLDNDWRKALDYENMLQVQAYMSEEHEEGVDAFLEGRNPDWD
ncbi:enoyl-CoA hydratase/isomerase family protein [Haloarchaeobius iranensis]|uniref:2-(1,2-epoxy-1,2-dihydrophenyl)acetyl-CoA isomerase n=1 Tax=Haloarchaeobius iranensis TaxID=996166 RepID=A0A1G9YXG4_9EURY|nr:enoyl-CoA hydratase/isomerase family protein [Haloarchaeobius iranensis]SDN13385.1 2-(1,2-epoxy-1,2-dihydrophenyl)acetyl-CoA isomerase [Haloarchaeobius iranensis]